MHPLEQSLRRLGHGLHHGTPPDFTVLNAEETAVLTDLLSKLAETVPLPERKALKPEEMIEGGLEAIAATHALSDLRCNGCEEKCKLSEPKCGRGEEAAGLIKK